MNNDIRRVVDRLSTAREGFAIQAVAFDMDGLMLNTEDLYEKVGHILMQRRGKRYRDEVRIQMIGLAARQAFDILIVEEELTDSWSELQSETDLIFEEILPTELRAMPGLVGMLQRVESYGLPKCVATSSSRAFATKALSLVGMIDRVDFIITAEDVPRGKPYPDIYLAAADRMSVSVDRMLVLEDSPKGTEAGVAAGAYVVSVPNEHTRNGNFEGCKWIADTLNDPRLAELLKGFQL
jgi:HAD superfamily hydrolase (TIGR01509 family)